MIWLADGLVGANLIVKVVVEVADTCAVRAPVALPTAVVGVMTMDLGAAP